MNIYLAIMTTILVLTQVIRITQNAISLFRQERELKKQIGWIKGVNVTKEDVETQRDVMRMLRDLLEKGEILGTEMVLHEAMALLRDRLRGEADDL